jgi:hypothetical protein
MVDLPRKGGIAEMISTCVIDAQREQEQPPMLQTDVKRASYTPFINNNLGAPPFLIMHAKRHLAYLQSTRIC